MKFKCPKCQKTFDVENVDFKKWKCECGYQPTPVDIELDFKKEVDGRIKIINTKTYLQTKEELLKDINEGIKNTEDAIIIYEEKVVQLKSEIEILKKRKERVNRL